MKKAVKFISALCIAAALFMSFDIITGADFAASVFAEEESTEKTLKVTAANPVLTIDGIMAAKVTAELPEGVKTFGTEKYSWSCSGNAVKLSSSDSMSVIITAISEGTSDIAAEVTIAGVKYTGKTTVTVIGGALDVTVCESSVAVPLNRVYEVSVTVNTGGRTDIEYKVRADEKDIVKAFYSEDDGKIIIKGKKLGSTLLTFSYKYDDDRVGKKFIEVVVKPEPSKEKEQINLSTSSLVVDKGKSGYVSATLPERMVIEGDYIWSSESEEFELTPYGNGDVVIVTAAEDAKSGIYPVELTASYRDRGSGPLHEEIKAVFYVTIPFEPPVSPPAPEVKDPVQSVGFAEEEDYVKTGRPVTSSVNAAENAVKRLEKGTLRVSGKAAEKGFTAKMAECICGNGKAKVRFEVNKCRYTVSGDMLTSEKARVMLEPSIAVSLKNNTAYVKLDGKMSGAKSVLARFRINSFSGKDVKVYMDGKCIGKGKVNVSGWMVMNVTPQMTGKTLTVKVTE